MRALLKALSIILILSPGCAGDPEGTADGSVDAGQDTGGDTGSATDSETHDYGDPFDVTFFVVADTHFDDAANPENHIRAMNRISDPDDPLGGAVWPEEIDGTPTGFGGAGDPLDDPRGVVLVGDLCSWGGGFSLTGDGPQLAAFRSLYETDGDGDHERLRFPAYVGLGNHDLDPDGTSPFPEWYREQMWGYVDAMHRGGEAIVPVGSFDPASRNYSWDWERVHLIQAHRYAGDTEKGQVDGLPWIAADLEENAADERPVFLFQHYGVDGWASTWWEDMAREALVDTLDDYRVMAILVGHTHFAMNLYLEGIPVLQVNNAFAEIDEGNDDGNGSFLAVRVTERFVDAVTVRWLDDSGATELIRPVFHAEM